MKKLVSLYIVITSLLQSVFPQYDYSYQPYYQLSAPPTYVTTYERDCLNYEGQKISKISRRNHNHHRRKNYIKDNYRKQCDDEDSSADTGETEECKCSCNECDKPKSCCVQECQECNIVGDYSSLVIVPFYISYLSNDIFKTTTQETTDKTLINNIEITTAKPSDETEEVKTETSSALTTTEKTEMTTTNSENNTHKTELTTSTETSETKTETTSDLTTTDKTHHTTQLTETLITEEETEPITLTSVITTETEIKTLPESTIEPSSTELTKTTKTTSETETETPFENTNEATSENATEETSEFSTEATSESVTEATSETGTETTSETVTELTIDSEDNSTIVLRIKTRQKRITEKVKFKKSKKKRKTKLTTTVTETNKEKSTTPLTTTTKPTFAFIPDKLVDDEQKQEAPASPKKRQQYILTPMKRIKENFLSEYGIIPVPDIMVDSLLSKIKAIRDSHRRHSLPTMPKFPYYTNEFLR